MLNLMKATPFRAISEALIALAISFWTGAQLQGADAGSGLNRPMQTAATPIAGRSLLNILISAKQGLVDPTRNAAWSARERHSSSRYNNWTYPQRALRTPQFLYIRNFKPDRWPAGDPRALRDDGSLGPMHSAYNDIDEGPTKELLTRGHDDPVLGRFLQLAVAKRPAEELFDIVNDPACLTNLAANAAFVKTKADLANQLNNYFKLTGDPRVVGDGDIWETYPRYSPIRNFPAPDAQP